MEKNLKNTRVCMFAQGFLDDLAAKKPPAIQDMQVRSLGWKDLLEEEMAIHSRIRAWEIPWTEQPGGLQSIEPQRVGQD